MRQRIWNKLAVDWRPDRVHDQVRTIDFDELPTHFDAVPQGHGPRAHGGAHRAGFGRSLTGAPTRRTDVDRERNAPDCSPRPYAFAVEPCAGQPANARLRPEETAMTTYEEFHRRSLDDREAFWREQAALIDWQKPFTAVLDYSQPPFAKWFVGGETNLCHNAVDRHLADARRPAGADLHLDRDRAETRSYTYRELHAEVNRFAAMLQGARRGQGRPRADLHADDPRGDVRDARLRAHRRDPFGGLRRLRRGQPRHPHRRREAEGAW